MRWSRATSIFGVCMSFASPTPLPERRPGNPSSALELTTRALQPLLATPGVTELCINRPGEVFLETSDGWRREECAALDFDWCLRFAKVVANATHQRIDTESPLLSASLPTGAVSYTHLTLPTK